MAEAVKVMVRVRPMNQKQTNNKSKIIVQADQKTNQIILINQTQPDNNKHFSYDCIFSMGTAQSYIYQQTAFGMVQNVVEGYNATIFAYGQTGCGKTFTMMGVPQSQQLKGIIPRTFSHIINIIESTKQKKFLVRCSFLQIYNQEVHDLLSKDIKQKKQVKQSPDKGIYVKDLSMNIVKTLQQMDKYLNLGFKNRAVGATEMNKDSSRSHSIFTIYIETQQQGIVQTKYMAGKLNLVDLAGSQRQSKTKAEGDRLKQATKINLSLSALGNVISALVDGKSKHIPYRDSKLTRLLQDSLGGNTKTMMIANVSPADYNYEETLSTLRYASRAKFIKNKPVVNQDPKDALLKEYAEQIKRLKMMLEGKLPPQNMNLGNNQPQTIFVNGQQTVRTVEIIKTIEVGKQFQDKLRDKQQELKKNQQEKQAILSKLKSLQTQVVQGGQKQNTVQVKKYKDLKVKVKKQKAQQQKLLQQAQKAEQQLISVTENYKNIQQQNLHLRQKLIVLQSKYKQSKQQIKDLQLEHARQKYQLLQNIRWAQKDTKFYSGICKRIISMEQIEIIRSASQWIQQNNQYYIIPFLLKQKKVTFPKLTQRQVDALNKQQMKNRQLIVYQDDNKMKKIKSNWQHIDPRQATITKYKYQNNSNDTIKNGRKAIRQSRQIINNFNKQDSSKQLIMKSNKNVILAPINQDGDSITIQKQKSDRDRSIKLEFRDKTQLKRNRLLEPIK